MVYVTIKQPPMYHQMSIEEFLFSDDIPKNVIVTENTSNTRTDAYFQISDKLRRAVSIPTLLTPLIRFNEDTEHLRSVPRKSLYREFYLPKKSGGLRRIDAPNDELMDALRRLKRIFENDFHALYHTSAFAYIKKRSTVDAVKRHQSNESKWFAKLDLSNFFGSTTLDFVMKMFSMIYPFSEVVKFKAPSGAPMGENELRKALELAFLDGGLPQGTPISPLITNIMMIPVDYTLNKGFRDLNHQKYIYTRYADDFIISSRYHFAVKDVENYIASVLHGFDAPFAIKPEKTRYGSASGRNWNLGIMLNKDNEMTVGRKRKKELQTMLANYIMDSKSGVRWDKTDVQVMDGYRCYYRMIEGDTIDRIVAHINGKFNVDVVKMIRADLRAA